MTETPGLNIRPLLAALRDAGFLSETREVHRVMIDIQGGQSPLVYVQYEGDQDKITAVVEKVAQSMPIVETSAAHCGCAVETLAPGWEYAAHRCHHDSTVKPDHLPTHRGLTVPVQTFVTNPVDDDPIAPADDL